MSRIAHLNAGVRTKKAIKVKTETAMVKMTMARTTVMVIVIDVVLAWRGKNNTVISLFARFAVYRISRPDYLSPVLVPHRVASAPWLRHS